MGVELRQCIIGVRNAVTLGVEACVLELKTYCEENALKGGQVGIARLA